MRTPNIMDVESHSLQKSWSINQVVESDLRSEDKNHVENRSFSRLVQDIAAPSVPQIIHSFFADRRLFGKEDCIPKLNRDGNKQSLNEDPTILTKSSELQQSTQFARKISNLNHNHTTIKVVGGSQTDSFTINERTVAFISNAPSAARKEVVEINSIDEEVPPINLASDSD